MNDVPTAKAVASSGLPSGWSRAKLGDILPLQYGKGLVAKHRNSAGEVPVYGSSGIVGTHDEALTSGPTIIVGRKGSVGSVFLSKSVCWPIDTVYYTQPASCLDLSFFAHLLSHLNLSRLDRSTAVPGLTREDYNALEVAIPPGREQERIVAKIDELFSELDAGVASLKRARALLKKYRQAVLKAAVTGELTRDWRERHKGQIKESGADLLQRILKSRRQIWEAAELKKLHAKGKPPKDDRWKQKYKEPQPPDTSGLPDLPEGWVWASVDQLVSGRPRSLQSGPFGSNLLHSEFQQTGYLVLGIDNVGEGSFRLGSQNRISEAKFKALEKYRARPSDILITVMASLGRSCVVPIDIESSLVTKHLYRITVDQDFIIPKYLNLVIQGSPEFRSLMFKDARGQTRPGLNGEILKSLPVPLPPTIEQEAIVAEVERLTSVADVMEQEVVEDLSLSNSVRQSILKAAFAGKLVPQDPDDEPASVLLERIRAERAARPRPARDRRRKSEPRQLELLR